MKQLNKWIIGLVVLGLFGVIGYYATLNLIPKVIYRVVQKRMNIPVNSIAKPGLIDETARTVVMPNPDFIYAAAFFDLSDGPLNLSGSLPADDYWSLALYQPNTVNFFIRNDLEFGEDQLDLILANKKQRKAFDPELTKEIIECPVNKGFLLFRILVTDKDSMALETVLAHQSSIELKALGHLGLTKD